MNTRMIFFHYLYIYICTYIALFNGYDGLKQKLIPLENYLENKLIADREIFILDSIDEIERWLKSIQRLVEIVYHSFNGPNLGNFNHHRSATRYRRRCDLIIINPDCSRETLTRCGNFNTIQFLWLCQSMPHVGRTRINWLERESFEKGSFECTSNNQKCSIKRISCSSINQILG